MWGHWRTHGSFRLRLCSRSGATLGQLLVVVTVVLIIAVTVFPMFAQERGHQRDSCLSHLKQIDLALLMYADDHDGYFPSHDGWVDSVYPYLRNRDLFVCPQARRVYPGYGYNPTIAGPLPESLVGCEGIVVLYDADDGKVAERHHGGANYGFADGHVRWLADPPPEFSHWTGP